MIKTLFVLLFYANTNAQVDPGKIKIISKTVDTYIPSQNELVSAKYPYIQTPVQQLNKFMNAEIQKVVGVDKKNQHIQITDRDTDNLDDKPAESTIQFQINLVNSRFISLTIQKDSYAGGGGNGSSHEFFPLTFDLKNYKILKLKDAVKQGSENLVCKEISNQLKQTAKSLVDDFQNEESLQNVSALLNNSFSMSKTGLIVYWPLSYGHGEIYADVFLSFKKFKGELNKALITLAHQK